MIDLNKFAAALVAHLKTCRSAELVCNAPVAAESWFRIELVTALRDAGVKLKDIEFDYTYPGTRGKADLVILTPDCRTVIELKTFVCHADANKVGKFPAQLLRLEHLVRDGNAGQGLAFCTFSGYGAKRLKAVCDLFFATNWHVLGPLPLLDGAPLNFVIASFMASA